MRYLLIAGDGYYPQSGTRDWRRTFATEAEANASVVKQDHTRTILKGKQKGQEEYTHSSYLIDGIKYDWYEIVDLREWLERES